MEFDRAESDVIERACRAHTKAYPDLAMKVDQPIQRNLRMDAATELEIIANTIQQHRRDEASRGKDCANCDDWSALAIYLCRSA
jgi:hypothetical protein